MVEDRHHHGHIAVLLPDLNQVAVEDAEAEFACGRPRLKQVVEPVASGSTRLK